MRQTWEPVSCRAATQKEERDIERTPLMWQLYKEKNSNVLSSLSLRHISSEIATIAALSSLLSSPPSLGMPEEEENRHQMTAAIVPREALLVALS